MSESFPEKLSSEEAVIAEITAIKQNMEQTGSVDGERDQLDQVIAAFRTGEIDSATAIRKAYAVEGGRQDYH